MRTIIALGVMAVVLFGLAAGATVFLSHYLDEKNKGQHGEAAAAPDSAREKELPPLARTGEPAPRARPGSNPDAEQLAQEFAKLRERQENVARQEQQLTRRQRNLEIIKEDIRGEREEIDKVRKDLTEQVKGVGDDVAAVERRAQDTQKKLDAEKELIQEGKRGVYEADVVRAGGIKRVGGIYDTAEPADVARIFENMVESGDLMTAAQILSNMRERRAAAVLAAMQDKATAAQLTEKMVGLKQAAPPAAAPPGSRAPRPAAPNDGTR